VKKIKAFGCYISLVLGIILFATPISAVELPKANDDQGLIVFYRTNSFKGKAIRFNINHAEGPIGQLLNATYIYKYLEPGHHDFWSQAISQDSITVTVEAGKTYYIKGEVQMGILAGRPKFTQVSESDALAEISKLK